ncbi:unnamed protein product, partial [Polarella glacialis]
DPGTRATASQALDHAWFSSEGDTRQVSVPNSKYRLARSNSRHSTSGSVNSAPTTPRRLTLPQPSFNSKLERIVSEGVRAIMGADTLSIRLQAQWEGDLFVHVSELRDARANGLQRGDRVRFEVKANREKGKNLAANVVVEKSGGSGRKKGGRDDSRDRGRGRNDDRRKSRSRSGRRRSHSRSKGRSEQKRSRSRSKGRSPQKRNDSRSKDRSPKKRSRSRSKGGSPQKGSKQRSRSRSRGGSPKKSKARSDSSSSSKSSKK